MPVVCQDAHRYVMEAWLIPWKQKIVTCYVNQYRHYGDHTTSVVEGMHATFKRSLWSRTGDLTFVFQDLDRFWRIQKTNIEAIQYKK